MKLLLTSAGLSNVSIKKALEELLGKSAKGAKLAVIPDKAAKIFVYCLSGSRSIYAVEVMQKLGYTNVFDVAHGLLAWRVKHYPQIV